MSPEEALEILSKSRCDNDDYDPQPTDEQLIEAKGVLKRAVSLVKGEVAEGWATPVRDRMGASTVQDRQMVVYLDRVPDGSFPVLVVQKEVSE